MTKDGAGTVRETLESILNQELQPSFVVVVDDGSTDGTPELLRRMAADHANLFVVRNPSHSRDIRRVPALLNLGLSFAEGLRDRLGSPRFMMVSGDDNKLAVDYASTIIARMTAEPRIAVAAGSWTGSKSNQMPPGAGRFVRMDFMMRLGGRYPVAYGWEAWLIYKAMQSGYAVKFFGDATYVHLRPYSPRNLSGWGRGMYSLGFPSYFVFLRLAINLVWARRGTQSRAGSVAMAAGYLSAKLDPAPLRSMLIEDEGLKAFVRRYAAVRLKGAFL